jgi:hypothetical protein
MAERTVLYNCTTHPLTKLGMARPFEGIGVGKHLTCTEGMRCSQFEEGNCQGNAKITQILEDGTVVIKPA